MRQELKAGLALSLASLYIIFLAPKLIPVTADGLGAAQFTAIMCAVMTVTFSLTTKLPYFVGPGIVPASMCMAFYASGVPWPTVLGICFWAGLGFTILAVTGIVTRVIHEMPGQLKLSIQFAIGLYLLVAALKVAGITPKDGTLHVSQLGWAFLVGCVVTFSLDFTPRTKHYAILGGISAATVAAWMFGQVSLPGQFVTTLNLPTLVGADISSAFALEHLVRILTVFYVLAVDVVATLEIVASESSALRDPTGKPLHYDRAVILSGIATIAGPLLGFFPCLPFFESLAGVKSGGKTWRVSIVAAVVFVLAAFLSPIAATVPGAASAVALAFIGYSITKIAWTLFPAENEKGNYSRIIRYCQTFGILGAAYVGSISFAVLLTVAAYPLALLKSGSRPSRSDWAVAVTCFGLLLLSLN